MLVPRRNIARQATASALLLAICAIGACSSQPPADDKGPPQVGFVTIHPTSVSLPVELPGRTSAFRIAEVRPQISGVVLQRLFTEGSLVHRGQPLYRIDASLYRAAARQASANVASAQATAEATAAKAARYRPLAADQAVSAQDYTDAAAAARQAAASVAQTRAALSTARINLRYTTVPAPVTGRIGRSTVTEGALVTTDQANPLAVISVLDPIYVDIQQSAADVLRLRRQLQAGGPKQSIFVSLKLDDGSDYPQLGWLEFSEVTVDPGTGTVNLRARFPNPQGLLLPGLFVRATLTDRSPANVFLVPQAALTRDARGNAQVFVVGPRHKAGKAGGADTASAEFRAVTAAQSLGAAWVVTSGLRDGNRIITQGLGRIRPGEPVRAVPDATPQTPIGHKGQPSGTPKQAG